MKLFCDNKAAIDISHNPIQHDWTKHVEVDWHFIKQNLDVKIIRFPFVKSKDQLADILTKTVSSKIFHHLLDKLGLIDIYVPTWGEVLAWAVLWTIKGENYGYHRRKISHYNPSFIGSIIGQQL